eukprot:gene9338-10323_t
MPFLCWNLRSDGCHVIGLVTFNNRRKRVHLAPVQEGQLETFDVRGAIKFLENYGYLKKSGATANSLIDGRHFVESLERMQKFTGLKATGQLDTETVAVMNSERCGVADWNADDGTRSKRHRRFAIHSKKWNKPVLTWRIYNYGDDGLKKSKVRETFKNALHKWASVTNLSFKEITTGEPDIWFKFAHGDHGDNSPFQLPYSRVIAHAFYPKYGTLGLAGDVHFNDAKRFAISSSEGKNLAWITLHELGHSIGMLHSGEKDSVMYPYYRGYNGVENQLHKDDIKGAQELYGVKDPTNPTVSGKTTLKPPVEKPHECFSRVTAIFLAANKKTYMFNAAKLWILDGNLAVEKGPISVDRVFKGMKTVDAAFQRDDGNSLLFSGRSFFVYNAENVYISGPHLIADHFNGLSKLHRIDAAFVWPGNRALYIFKGKRYWRYRPVSNGKKYMLDATYPRKIKHGWIGIPRHGLDGMFTWKNGITYLFKSDKYYALNKRLLVIKGYPKPLPSSNRKAKLSCMISKTSLNIEEEAASSGSRLSPQSLSLAGSILTGVLLMARVL